MDKDNVAAVTNLEPPRQCTQTNHIELQTLFSLRHLWQGLPSGNHLLNQWHGENKYVTLYPINHQCETMGRYPSLSTYSVHDNRWSFLTPQSSS